MNDRGGPIPRSPDLPPCDFLLWGWIYQKHRFSEKIGNLCHLRDVIRDAVSTVTGEMLFFFSGWGNVAQGVGENRSTF